MDPGAQHQVVIVGGGFGGLYAVRALARAPVQVTLVDRRNFHLFQPLLYQVATGGLSPANIAAPLRSVLKRQANARVLLAEATGFDVARRRLLLSDGELPYDTLLVATGSTHHYFGHQDWEPLAPGLKTVEDATEIRRRMLLAFEEAEREPSPDEVRRLLGFVVVGAGPTGVELAGALAEIARHTLRSDFRRIDPADARIVLVDAVDRVLPTYPPELSEKARRELSQLGVEVRLNARVTDVAPDRVTLEFDGRVERLTAHTAVWAAGVKASPLGNALAQAAGVPSDPQGRLIVEPDLSLPGHPEILVLGDLARFDHQPGGALPGIAPVAMQQGRHAARLIRARLDGRPSAPFVYRDRGSMAVIGRTRAVADVGGLRFGGFVAWLAWLFIHLMYLVGFTTRLLVFLQWAWSYLTFNRSARLITGPSPLPLRSPDALEESRRPTRASPPVEAGADNPPPPH